MVLRGENRARLSELDRGVPLFEPKVRRGIQRSCRINPSLSRCKSTSWRRILGKIVLLDDQDKFRLGSRDRGLGVMGVERSKGNCRAAAVRTFAPIRDQNGM